MKPECIATDPICISGEEPTNVIFGMTWVENGWFEPNMGGIEAEWLCGPFVGSRGKNGPPVQVFRRIPARAVGPAGVSLYTRFTALGGL